MVSRLRHAGWNSRAWEGLRDELVKRGDESVPGLQKIIARQVFHTHTPTAAEKHPTNLQVEICMKTPTLTRRIAGRSAAALFALAAGVVFVSTASAGTPATDVPMATVRYGDLDLSTNAGAKTLYNRISMVARQVCPSDESRDLSRLHIARACQQAAIERAVRSVNSPHLAAAYAAATHRG